MESFWTSPNVLLTVPANVSKVLSEAQGTDGKPLYTKDDIERIMQATQSKEIKDALTAKTDEAITRGAFGAPWFWVTNDAGQSEPFFGSDRFHFIYKFLGLPYQDVALLPPGGNSKL